MGSSSLDGFCRYCSHYLSGGFDRSVDSVAVAVGVSLVEAYEHFEYVFVFFCVGFSCCSGCVGGKFLYVVLRRLVVVKLVVAFGYRCFCGTVMDLADC
mgnify:CR=1 FL=1